MTEIDVAKAATQEADTRYGKPMPSTRTSPTLDTKLS